MTLIDWASGRMFQLVHRHNLIYNTCWEDPRLDRAALRLGPGDTVLVITSAGCNALDYVLTGPGHVHAVDVNPRQNALLELKLAGIRGLEFEDFYAMFGRGRLPGVRRIYADALRGDLTPWSQDYWDRWIGFFDNARRPFYFRGTAGGFARLLNLYLDRIIKVRYWIDAILAAATVSEQREIYERQLRDRFWSRPLQFAMGRDATLSLVGVPRAQRVQVEQQYEGGIVAFLEDCVEAVFARLPLRDNYFWRVYLTGSYTPDCCPEYLRPENFQRLRAGLAERVSVHTNSVQGFLEKHEGWITHFVLLDHMDWLSSRYHFLLEAEWQAILRRAVPGARIVWRSAGLRTEFLDRVQVTVDGCRRVLGELLSYERELAEQLHARDRVHTYGSFHIANLVA